MTAWERLNSPVVVGCVIALALFLGFWSGHVITFRTCYFLRYCWRCEREEEEEDG